MWKEAIKFGVSSIIENLSEDDFYKIVLTVPESVQTKILAILSNSEHLPHNERAHRIHAMLDEIFTHFSSKNTTKKNEAKLENIVSLYPNLFKYCPKRVLPISVFELLLNLPDCDIRIKLLQQLNETLLSDDQLIHLFDVVHQYQLHNSKSPSNEAAKEFIQHLFDTIKLATKLTQLTIWHCLNYSEQQFILQLFVEIIPPFGELGNKNGAKAELFQSLQEEIPWQNENAFMSAYRVTILEHLNQCRGHILSAKSNRDALMAIAQIAVEIRHQIKLIKIEFDFSTKNNHFKSEGKVEFYKSVLKLCVPVRLFLEMFKYIMKIAANLI